MRVLLRLRRLQQQRVAAAAAQADVDSATAAAPMRTVVTEWLYGGVNSCPSQTRPWCSVTSKPSDSSR